MKHHIIISKLAILLSAFLFACSHFLHPVPPPKPVTSGISVTFDPLGHFVTTTTVPVTIGSTTYALTLFSPTTSTVKFGLTAPSAQSQVFLNNNGNFVFQFLPSPLAASTTFTASNCVSTSSCTVDLSPIIAQSGTYPFALFLFVAGQEGSVTGTINVP